MSFQLKRFISTYCHCNLKNRSAERHTWGTRAYIEREQSVSVYAKALYPPATIKGFRRTYTIRAIIHSQNEKGPKGGKDSIHVDRWRVPFHLCLKSIFRRGRSFACECRLENWGIFKRLLRDTAAFEDCLGRQDFQWNVFGSVKSLSGCRCSHCLRRATAAGWTWMYRFVKCCLRDSMIQRWLLRAKAYINTLRLRRQVSCLDVGLD